MLKIVVDFKLLCYLGIWYEIVCLLMCYELEGCIDVLVYYILFDNGNVGVINCCCMDGEIEEVIGEVCVVDNDSVCLEVSFLFKGLCWLLFVKGDYWVI